MQPQWGGGGNSQRLQEFHLGALTLFLRVFYPWSKALFSVQGQSYTLYLINVLNSEIATE
jgi:hypothetical protein